MSRSSPTRRTGTRSRTDRAPAGERGAALLEMALVSVLLLTMVFGLIEFGGIFSRVHTMTSLSREGANLAARGTSLDQAVDVVLANGSDVSLASLGGVVATRLEVDDGVATVVEQRASAGYTGASRLGEIGDPVLDVDTWGMVDGQKVYIMEVFLDYESVTPLEPLVGVVVPTGLYERAVF